MEANGALARWQGPSFYLNLCGGFSSGAVGWTINSHLSGARLRYRKDHYLIFTSWPGCQNFITHTRSNAYLQEKQPRWQPFLPFPRATGHAAARII
jgi:hypothetical protein